MDDGADKPSLVNSHSEKTKGARYVLAPCKLFFAAYNYSAGALATGSVRCDG